MRRGFAYCKTFSSLKNKKRKELKMEKQLEEIIKSLKKIFLSKGILFDGKTETFLEMLNYEEVQNAIVEAIRLKVNKFNSKFERLGVCDSSNPGGIH